MVVTLDNPASDSLFGVDHVHLALAGASPRDFRIVRAGPGRQGQVILHLEGIERIEDAESLRGCEVLLEEAQFPPLEDREYWHRDLLGLRAFDPEGAALGEVAEVVDTAEVPVLVLRGDGSERFVPFADPYVIRVELDDRRIVLAPPEETGA